jgi:peptide deformylase
MSEILTIDTGSSISPTKLEEKIEPLVLYGENFEMLNDEIPLYRDELPNFEMSNLIKRLKMTMKLYGGIGLSANQCGIYERVFVIGTDQFQIACINPKVLEVSQEINKDNEGCLSFPGLFLKVPRPISVHAEFMDEFGETRRMWLDGITARCYLHELDHMNGVKFTSKVGTVTMSQARRKQSKLMKKIQRSKKDGV